MSLAAAPQRSIAERLRDDETTRRLEANGSTVTELFEEEPVALRTFISDKKFLGADWMLSEKQLELVSITERVYLPEMYPMLAEEFGGYWLDHVDLPMKHFVNAQWGKGGGKDSTIRVAALRVAYLLMCLKSPQAYFEMPEDDSIHLLNIAVNAPQAHRAFFEPMTRMVKRGWFADRADPHRDTITYAKNITAISGHSDAESQEGLNIMLGVADEIDAFKAKGEMVGQGGKAREASTSAESILEMLKTSASTRFPRSYKRVAISFPRYLGSTIQQLTAEAKFDIEQFGDTGSDYFASGPYATWEVNPTKTREMYDRDYRKDPKAAAAKYECKPDRAVDAYFKNPIIFRNAVTRETQPIRVDYQLTSIPSDVTGITTVGWEPIFDIDPEFLPIEGARYAMHGDLAIVGDRAGIAMSHVKEYQTRITKLLDAEGAEYEEEEVVPIIVNDFTIYFSADSSARDNNDEPLPREIQMRWAMALIVLLIRRGFSVTRFTFDGFQSADLIQRLERHGIISEKFSLDLKLDGWKTLKDVASEGRLQMAWHPLLQQELEALSKIGKKIDHPPNGSKDLADAFAGSVTGAIEEGGEEGADTRQVDVDDTSIDMGSTFGDYDGMEYASGSLPMGMKGFGGYGEF